MNDQKGFTVDLLERSYGRWWLMLIDGLCLMIICGITLFNSQFVLVLLIKIFGVYRGLMGIMYLATYFVMQAKYKGSMGYSLGRGLFDLIIAAIFLFIPTTIISFFVIMIGIIALIAGIILLVTSGSRRGIGKTSRMITGVILIGFGIYAFFDPLGQSAIFGLVLGIVLGISGFFLVLQSLAMKKSYQTIKKQKKGYQDYHID